MRGISDSFFICISSLFNPLDTVKSILKINVIKELFCLFVFTFHMGLMSVPGNVVYVISTCLGGNVH